MRLCDSLRCLRQTHSDKPSSRRKMRGSTTNKCCKSALTLLVSSLNSSSHTTGLRCRLIIW
ncbi:Uncharacterised protein [Vibrio cholerae]|uniref:Uncharacterized protein n=1 Tax=Vibrio cholerae TaxID=666 RepID=A0A655NT32_VIBCL|nr:Uncharacterised protein [Vibrio cholerae]CRZ79210.1 Uncharacterised protein [Vibrio cholerae]